MPAGVKVNFAVTESPEIIKELRRLAEIYGVANAAYNTVLATARRAAGPLVEEVRARTPKLTGKLAATAQAQVFFDYDKSKVNGRIGWFGLSERNPRFMQGISIEFGTKWHRKRPVIVPALERHADRMTREMAATVRKDLERGAATLAKRSRNRRRPGR